MLALAPHTNATRRTSLAPRPALTSPISLTASMSSTSSKLSTTCPARASSLASLRRSCALALALVACVLNAHAQGSRKPTVTDQDDDTAAARTSNASTRNAPSTSGDAQGENASRSGETRDGETIDGDAQQREGKSLDAANVKGVVRQRRVSGSPLVVAPNSGVAPNSVGASGVTPPPSSGSAQGSPVSSQSSLFANGTGASLPATKAAESGGVAVSPEARVEAELEALRAQIVAAKTEAERTPLQQRLAERLVELNRTADAVTVLRMSMREERFDPVGFYRIGNSLARLDDAQAAAEAYRKAIAQKNGNYSRAQNNLGVVLLRLGHWDEAAEALTAALRLENGNYAEASYNLGRLYAARGEQGQAISEWQRTLSLDPEHAEAAVSLARAYAQDGDAARALKVLDAFAARFKKRSASLPASVNLARNEIAAGRSPEAAPADAIRLAVNEDEKSSAANANAATKTSTAAPARNTQSVKSAKVDASSDANSVAASRADESSAPSSKVQPFAVSPQTYELLQRARVARDAGNNQQSVALYRRVLAQQGGYFPPASLELSYVLVAMQRADEAIDALQTVAARDGARYPFVFYHLGRLYERAGQLGNAAEAFTRAAALYGDTNPQPLLDVSRVREREGNTQAALAAMESYLRALERLGSTPDWARDRLAQLRQKSATAPTASNPKQ